MRIQFYYTQKRDNSLIRPDEDESQVVVTTFDNFTLKEEVDMLNPTFKIIASNFPETNYAILSGYGGTVEFRQKLYYWVESIEHVRETVWLVHCRRDSLATWKDVIKGQVAYVERSYSHNNPYIFDSAIPTTGNCETRQCYNARHGGMVDTFTDGTLFLAVKTSGINAGTGIPIYAMNHIAFDAFMTWFNSPSILQSIKDSLNNPVDCILGAWWVPVSYDYVSGHPMNSMVIAGNTFDLSSLTSSGRMKVLGGGSLATEQTGEITVNLRKYGDYRDTPQMRNLSWYLPAVGCVDCAHMDTLCKRLIDSADGNVIMEFSSVIDYVAKSITYLITDFYNDTVYVSASAPIGIDLPVGHFKTGVAGAIAGGVGALGALAGVVMSGGTALPAIAGAVGAGAGIAGGTLYAVSGGTNTVIGGFGGQGSYLLTPYITATEQINGLPLAPALMAGNLGRPCYNNHQIGALTGYCKTMNFHVKGRMLLPEKEAIDNYFNGSGVFVTETA